MSNIDDFIRRIAEGDFDTRTGLEERVGRVKVRLEFNNGNDVVFRKTQ